MITNNWWWPFKWVITLTASFEFVSIETYDHLFLVITLRLLKIALSSLKNRDIKLVELYGIFFMKS